MIDFNRPDAVATAGRELDTTSSMLVATLADRGPIATDADLAQAVADRRRIGDAIKAVEAFFAPIKSMAHQLHVALCTREKVILAPLLKLDDSMRGAMTAYNVAEAKARRQREAALADEQRRDREARAVTEAAQLERAGEVAMAAAVVAEAIAAPAPVVVLPDTVAAVATFRKVWKWRYVGGDKARAMALLPRDFLMPDEVKIGAYARSMKTSGDVPGIEFYAEDVPVR